MTGACTGERLVAGFVAMAEKLPAALKLLDLLVELLACWQGMNGCVGCTVGACAGRQACLREVQCRCCGEVR